AAAITPWRRRQLHAGAPGWAKKTVGGIPVITLAAIVSGLSWAFVIWTAFHTGFGGALGLKPMLEAFTAPIIAIVYYVAVRAYRGRLADEEVEAAFADPEAIEARFHRLMAESLEGWLRLAEERLAGSGVRLYVMMGNDDPPHLRELIDGSQIAIDPEEKVI